MFCFFTFCHIVKTWKTLSGLILPKIFAVQHCWTSTYLNSPSMPCFFCFSHLVNWAEVVILNVIGRHVECISCTGEMCAWYTPETWLPSRYSHWIKCGSVWVSVVVLILNAVGFCFLVFFLLLSSHRSQSSSHPLVRTCTKNKTHITNDTHVRHHFS